MPPGCASCCRCLRLGHDDDLADVLVAEHGRAGVRDPPERERPVTGKLIQVDLGVPSAQAADLDAPAARLRHTGPVVQTWR
jgi:hypothetical protein